MACVHELAGAGVVMGHFNASWNAHEILNKSELFKQKLSIIRCDENENEYANEM
jgi:hypothetical protein